MSEDMPEVLPPMKIHVCGNLHRVSGLLAGTWLEDSITDSVPYLRADHPVLEGLVEALRKSRSYVDVTKGRAVRMPNDLLSIIDQSLAAYENMKENGNG